VCPVHGHAVDGLVSKSNGPAIVASSIEVAGFAKLLTVLGALARHYVRLPVVCGSPISHRGVSVCVGGLGECGPGLVFPYIELTLRYIPYKRQ
jgi:hypothetical protein